MARIRLDPEVVEECATRNGWSLLQDSVDEPGWPPLVVVRAALDERDRWLAISRRCARNLPGPNSDPEPSQTPDPRTPSPDPFQLDPSQTEGDSSIEILDLEDPIQADLLLAPSPPRLPQRREAETSCTGGVLYGA